MAKIDSVDKIMDLLKGDEQARAAVTKMLARDFPDEFLKHVKIDTEKLRDVSARFVASDKEWQE